MTTRMRFFCGGLAMLLVASAEAQPPAPSVDPDKAIVDVLKEIHNRGADLYNRGLPSECYRMYEGALITARAFLAHRPAVVKIIDDGLADVARTDGVKIQAFRMHEIIEQVRGELKAPKKSASSPPSMPSIPMQMPKEKSMEATAGGPITGKIAIDGKPLAGGEVSLVSVDLPAPRVFMGTVKDGVYVIAGPLPPGKYLVMVSPAAGTKLAEKYQSPQTSGLAVQVVPGLNAYDIALSN